MRNGSKQEPEMWGITHFLLGHFNDNFVAYNFQRKERRTRQLSRMFSEERVEQNRSSRFFQLNGIRCLVALGRSIELSGNFQSLLHEKQPVCIGLESFNNVVVKLRLRNSLWSEGTH